MANEGIREFPNGNFGWGIERHQEVKNEGISEARRCRLPLRSRLTYGSAAISLIFGIIIDFSFERTFMQT
jgi:hypothetical protein